MTDKSGFISDRSWQIYAIVCMKIVYLIDMEIVYRYTNAGNKCEEKYSIILKMARIKRLTGIHKIKEKSTAFAIYGEGPITCVNHSIIDFIEPHIDSNAVCNSIYFWAVNFLFIRVLHSVTLEKSIFLDISKYESLENMIKF